MKSLIIIFGALLLIIGLPAFFTSVNDAQVQEYTQTFAGVTTGAAVYSANVTLSEDLHNDSVISVTDSSSNITSDSPSAGPYNSVSGVLTVNGLDASQMRTLSITYEIASTLLASGMGIFFTMSIWFWLFAIIGMIAGAIYAFFN